MPFNGPADEKKYEDLERVIIGDDPKKLFQAGAKLPLQERKQLVEFLRENVDVFAWSAYEALGIDPSFICHHLNVNPSITLKRQPPRHPSKEHAEAVRNEVAKLKQAEAIKEVFLSLMVSQYSGGEKEDWEMVCVHGLHGPQ